MLNSTRVRLIPHFGSLMEVPRPVLSTHRVAVFIIIVRVQRLSDCSTVAVTVS